MRSSATTIYFTIRHYRGAEVSIPCEVNSDLSGFDQRWWVECKLLDLTAEGRSFSQAIGRMNDLLYAKANP